LSQQELQDINTALDGLDIDETHFRDCENIGEELLLSDKTIKSDN
jgi:hypothetical protein